MYTIKQAAALSGVSAALLRAWERRYRVVAPSRTASGYRLYDDAAIDRLKAMRLLVAAGWSASTAATAVLSGDPLPAEARIPAPERRAGEALDGPASGLPGQALLAGAIDLDAERMEAALDRIFAAGSFERVADDLLLPALVAIGAAWEDGRLSVAGEHAASHAVLRRLSAAFQAAGRPVRGEGAILVGMPPGGRHELGALAFAVAARRAGLPILYLGPDLPLQDWVDTARDVHAVAAVIGAVTADDASRAADVAAALAAAVPRSVIAFGGVAAQTAAARLGAHIAAVVLPNGVVNAVDRLRTELSAAR